MFDILMLDCIEIFFLILCQIKWQVCEHYYKDTQPIRSFASKQSEKDL